MVYGSAGIREVSLPNSTLSLIPATPNVNLIFAHSSIKS